MRSQILDLKREMSNMKKEINQLKSGLKNILSPVDSVNKFFTSVFNLQGIDTVLEAA